MSYDNYFNHLDSLGKDKNKSIQINCCNDHSNFLIDDGIASPIELPKVDYCIQ